MFMNLTEFNQSDHCKYFSCPERSTSSGVYILLYVCSAAVVLLTVCGNMLVIISVFHFKQLHTPTNSLVLSLAVSDFLVAIFLMPVMFIWIIEACWIFGRVFCNIYWLINSLLNISVYTIAQIAVDRYLALSNPFLYINIVSVRITCVVIVFNWSIMVVYILSLLYFSGSFTSSVMCPRECFVYLNDIWSVIDLLFSFIFPLSVIILFYTNVFVIAKKHATTIREPKTQGITPQTIKSERKAAKVLGILVSVFLVCLLPYFIYSLLGGVIQLQTDTLHKFVIIMYLNSTINPFIYALFYPWFRRSIKLIVTLQIFQRDSTFINVLS